MKKLFAAVICLSVALAILPTSSASPPITARPAATASAAQYLPLVMKPYGDSANESVPSYSDSYQYGLNPGYYANDWTDNDVHQLCYDAGCRSARNSLPDSFIATWGADIRLDVYKHITTDLQFHDITVFLGQPRDEWRDTTTYDGSQSKLWQGMYTPIWDNGENGTPVNDENRFALYVWTIVKTYGPYIRFYEIINEPDYTYSSYGWAEPGTTGSWWDNPPQAKDLPNLNAPIYQYIRLLRIAYEVVKHEQPDAYVTPGGIGYASFLDALLRYTDNPDAGKVTSDYPLTGGAYFDALSFHCYPQFGTRHWDGTQWVPDRFSDKAAEVLIDSKAEFEDVLTTYHYNGTTYPKKIFIVTELNVSRKQVDETLGGQELQRNFTIKALVKAQQADIKQMYWYTTGEVKDYDDSSAGSYDLMGFYENLTRDKPGDQIITDQGIANRTTFQQLYNWAYDDTATQALDLPSTIDGAAFKQGSSVRYVLWAKTSKDRDETASASITLPGSYTAVKWDGSSSTVSGSNLALTGAPVFLTPATASAAAHTP